VSQAYGTQLRPKSLAKLRTDFKSAFGQRRFPPQTAGAMIVEPL